MKKAVPADYHGAAGAMYWTGGSVCFFFQHFANDCRRHVGGMKIRSFDMNKEKDTKICILYENVK